MLLLLRRHGLNELKFKIIVLYFLNVFDIIFTKLLLKTGLFTEANSFMRLFINNSLIIGVLKIIVPAVILYIFYLRLSKANEKQIIISNIGINFCLLLYTLIIISHILWSALAVYTIYM